MKPIIDNAAPLPEAFDRMRQRGTHHLVVEKDGDIVGIVSDRDLLFKGIPLHGEVLNPMLTVADVMTPLPKLLSEQSSVDEALELMATYRTDAVPMVRGGEVLQIVTQTELLRLVGRLLHRDAPLLDVTDHGRIALANPVVQNVMNLVAEMGL